MPLGRRMRDGEMRAGSPAALPRSLVTTYHKQLVSFSSIDGVGTGVPRADELIHFLHPSLFWHFSDAVKPFGLFYLLTLRHKCSPEGPSQHSSWPSRMSLLTPGPFSEPKPLEELNINLHLSKVQERNHAGSCISCSCPFLVIHSLLLPARKS